ncbi:MAG TPA: biopolymer transporter ExbD [Edaphocola sp.]|nr:biopolymer transporter ExbD [Edaphocola sp.]
MPKIKMPRKSTHIDMTAMCDVAFLLLTFFMLATKFKPMEPVQVVTPASTSTKVIPTGFIQITLDKDGRVFYNVDNLNAKKGIIEEINKNKKLGLTPLEMQSFVSNTAIGVPFSQLKSYLALTPAQQEAYDKTKAAGIPTDTTGNYETNELAYWITTSRYQLLEQGTKARIAIKADGSAKYPDVQKLIATLGNLKIFRFSFITNSKAVPKGTALSEEQAAAKAAGGK